jgi:hypothetical protein
MSGRERRLSPRKDCIVPVRFRILSSGLYDPAEAAVDELESPTLEEASEMAVVTGETVNLSDRGVFFRSRHAVSVGQSLEIYLTLPRELTGRNPEQVRCSAKVVRTENDVYLRGFTGVGASIERFEPIIAKRDWSN